MAFRPLLAIAFAFSVCVLLSGHGASASNPSSPSTIRNRLIETGPGQRVWMSAQEIENLVVAGQKNQFIDVTDFLQLDAPISRELVVNEFPSRPTHQDEVEKYLPDLKADNIRNTIASLSSLHNRYYTAPTGVEAAQLLYNQYKTIASQRSDIEVSYFENKNFIQPSVITRLKGSGPNADELIILGGHLDSIASGGASGRAPGADDDGSGSSTVLEIFRALVTNGFKPKRTVEFHAYAAEEAGLLGSQAIASAYKNAGAKVAAMLNLDMVAYTKPGSVPVVGLVQDNINANLTSFVSKLIDTYANIGWVKTNCGYACSDHASWNRAGYPSCFPFETPFGSHNPYIHTSNDLLVYLNLEHAIEFAKIGLSFVVELGLDQ